MSKQTIDAKAVINNLCGAHEHQGETIRQLRKTIRQLRETSSAQVYKNQCAVIDTINKLRREAQADIDRVSGLLRDVRGRSNRQNNTIASMRADARVLTNRCADQAVLLAKIRDMANGE